ncbi:hypothetical protein TNCV_2353781 [Trichonephila clavipes]|nr:hypothetical protein TNCV_2353781 [Trichonephila clavipes]
MSFGRPGTRSKPVGKVSHLRRVLCPVSRKNSVQLSDDDTNVDSEKELSLEQKLELAVAKKFLKTKLPYRNQPYPKPSNERFTGKIRGKSLLRIANNITN